MRIQKPPCPRNSEALSLPAVIMRLQICAWQTQGSLFSSSNLNRRSKEEKRKILFSTWIHDGTQKMYQPTKSSITCMSLSLAPFYLFKHFCFKNSLSCPCWMALENNPALWKDLTMLPVPPGFSCSFLLNEDEPCSEGISPRT